MNPLFDASTDSHKPKNTGYVLPRQSGKEVHPLSGKKSNASERNAAVELIRRKLNALYVDEPDAAQEQSEVTQQPPVARSPHQHFMHQLSSSGKSLAEIQTAWHAYYAGLPDAAKHEVWREFYDHNSRASASYHKAASTHQATLAAVKTAHNLPSTQPSYGLQLHPEATKNTRSKVVVAEHQIIPVASKSSARISRSRHIAALKKQVLHTVHLSATQQQKAKQHFQSLLFGVTTGVVVILIFLFSFFNEVIIAPFIQPSRTVSSTPIILSNDSVAASDTPEVIIPKINVQIPVIFDEKTVDEDAIQRALERGVIHYASTSLPGEQGNTAIFGHSSNNIFNNGRYKFAFVKLNELVPGDVFYLTRDKKVYAYRVYEKRIVNPDQIEVLRPVDGKAATATLITCDPPGTSKHRLVVWGEQISPDPSGATIATTPNNAAPETAPASLASEGPTLWKRLTSWLF